MCTFEIKRGRKGPRECVQGREATDKRELYKTRGGGDARGARRTRHQHFWIGARWKFAPLICQILFHVLRSNAGLSRCVMGISKGTAHQNHPVPAARHSVLLHLLPYAN